MKYNIGDCVKNNKKKDNYSNGDVIPKGTKGRVTDFFGTSAYVVLFEGAASDHWILEKDLDNC